MSRGRAVITDSGFWYALFDHRDTHHSEAKLKQDLIASYTLLLPWPVLYETFNTRFAKNQQAIQRFRLLLRQPRVVLLSDEPYRREALEAAFVSGPDRSMALVDMVIRLILDDTNVRKHGLLTFNPGDFSDLCRKHRIEMV